jgi:penicillin-binding protein 1A
MRLAQLFLVLVILVPLLMAGAVYGLFVVWGHDLPSPRRPQEVEPPRNTVILDRYGEPIDEFFVENRNPVPLEQIPEVMRNAVLATEDRRFYRHWGVDLAGIVRAVLSNLAAGGIRQGASTITQQLARNVFLSHSQTVERKIKEAVLAIRLERSFSKEEILELYLNQIYFGEGTYGVEAAARRFFGKSCRELTLPEAALLAGLPANPSAYSPLRHPQAAERRRNAVLRKMEAAGWIDGQSRRAAEATAVALSPSSGRASSNAPYFAEMVRQELMDRFGADKVYGGGLTVHTTLDLRLQHAAESALEDQLEAIEAKEALVYRRLRGTSVRSEAAGGRQAITPYLQGALVALEPQNGAVRALVGGRDFNDSNFNRAVQARRQPGSAFKPIVVAEALKEGHRTNEILLDAPVTYRWGTQVWSPKNFDHDFSGNVTLRYVLMKSINVPSVRLLDRIGPRNVIRLARDFGIEGPLVPQLSLALGTGEVTPLELTSAYATFADNGIRQTPYVIERVEDHFGNVLQEHKPESREVLDEKTSYLMVSLLQSVIDRGTGNPARSKYDFAAPAAGKTGTTDDYSDAWFVGFVPRLACGVWVGFDEKKSIGSRMTGAAAALPAWTSFMKTAVEVYGKEDFVAPEGVVSVATCQQSGLLATPGCPRVVNDVFVAGTQPGTYCPLHQGLASPTDTETQPELDTESGETPAPNR